MTLRELDQIIDNYQRLTKTFFPFVDNNTTRTYEVIPYRYTRYESGKVVIHCEKLSGEYDQIIMHTDPSPTTDPLDAELR